MRVNYLFFLQIEKMVGIKVTELDKGIEDQNRSQEAFAQGTLIFFLYPNF